MRVLIAEDDATSRMILKAVLVKWGYEVIETQDGNEAWEALQKDDAPRLAILDRVMPGMNGEKICQKLREIQTTKATYVILLTSKREMKDVVEGLEAGANDYIRKPFDREELHARVRVGERVLELESALSKRILELLDALAHVKTLQGLLPICMHCHKIRNDQQTWERLEKYISEHTDAQFTHGLCPECAEQHYNISIQKRQPEAASGVNEATGRPETATPEKGRQDYYDEMNRHVAILEAIIDVFRNFSIHKTAGMEKDLQILSHESSVRLDELKNLMTKAIKI